jgi:pimeloyl-ACP methyl ester carboxylesterase
MLFAATYPERTEGLVLINLLASPGALGRVPVASLPRRAGAEHREDGPYVGDRDQRGMLAMGNPDMAEDERMAFARALRLSVSPAPCAITCV